MRYIAAEDIARAKEMDLLTYLRNYEPQELVHVSGNTYCTREHDSLRISNGKWCWFSQGIGGRSALDYAKQYGLATRTDDEKMIGARIDAVIPELRLAFAFSQKGTDREAKVAEVLHFLCKAKRIQLFVIRQKDPIALATEIKQAFAKANLFINSDSQRDVAHLRKRYFAQKNNGN